MRGLVRSVEAVIGAEEARACLHLKQQYLPTLARQ